MPSQQHARAEPCASAADPTDDMLVVETRFGTFEFPKQDVIHMPRGPHGFTEYRDFGIANLPAPAPEHFKLLQSLEDPQLSFIVTYLEPMSGAIDIKDLRDGALSVGIPFEEAHFLLIVTLRVNDRGTTTTINLRAPIVLDVARRIARQVVLANTAYPIQQPL